MANPKTVDIISGLVTKETNRSLSKFLENIKNPTMRKDCHLMIDIMREITGQEPKVWGNARKPDYFIGFGNYTYQVKGAKKAHKWFELGFVPGPKRFSVHLNFDLENERGLINEIGNCVSGRSCLYFTKLDNINLDFFIQLLDKSRYYQQRQFDG